MTTTTIQLTWYPKEAQLLSRKPISLFLPGGIEFWTGSQGKSFDESKEFLFPGLPLQQQSGSPAL